MLSSRLSRGTRRFSTTQFFDNAMAATKDVPRKAIIASGGFGLCGIPENCITAMMEHGTQDLTWIKIDANVSDVGMGPLIKNNQINKLVTSYIGPSQAVFENYYAGKLGLELIPQGTLTEKMRCGGNGVPAFFTRTGLGTVVQKGGFPIRLMGQTGGIQQISDPKPTMSIGGQTYIREKAITVDYGFVKGHVADEDGNVSFNKSAVNFNMDVAKASRTSIVEVEEIVPRGSLKPEEIHLPHIYVDRVFKGTDYVKKIEMPTFSNPDGSLDFPWKGEAGRKRKVIASRAALEIDHGAYVNLGIGIPTVITNYLDESFKVTFQSENGLLGLAGYPLRGDEEPDLINAGKESVTTTADGSFFSSSETFLQNRGGHLLDNYC